MGFCAFATPQTTWVKRSPVTIENQLFYVAWNGEMFIAVGENGEIRTSIDGDVWIKQESGTVEKLIFVCSSAKMSVAVSDSGVLFNSSDGVNWTKNSSIRLGNIFWINDCFVSIMGNGLWLHGDRYIKLPAKGTWVSPDGISWNRVESDTDRVFRSTIWTGEKIFAIFEDSIGTSTDGIAWTWRPMDMLYDKEIHTIRWTGEQLLGVGMSGDIKYVAHSTDGALWEYDTVKCESDNVGVSFVDIAAHGDTVCAVSGLGNIFFLSVDQGKNWIRSAAWIEGNSSMLRLSRLNSLCWVDGIYVMVGYFATDDISGANIFFVGNGTGSSKAVYAPTTDALYSVVSGGSTIVAVGGYGTILSSPDGIAWTNCRDTTVTVNRLSSVIWSGTKFLAVGDSGTVIHSSDGTHWTRASSVTQEPLKSVAWTGSRFVAVGGSLRGDVDPVTYNRVITSPDGINWTDRGECGSGIWNSVIWTGNRLIAAGQVFSTSSPYASVIYTSTDGLSWTQQDGGTSFMGLYSVAGGDGHFVAVGGGAVEYCGLRSTDGITWGSTGIDCTYDEMVAITWGRNCYVAVGDGGKILCSADGLTWDSLNSGVSTTLNSITYTGSQYVATGNMGTIVTVSDGTRIRNAHSGKQIKKRYATVLTTYYDLQGRKFRIKNDFTVTARNRILIQCVTGQDGVRRTTTKLVQ